MPVCVDGCVWEQKEVMATRDDMEHAIQEGAVERRADGGAKAVRYSHSLSLSFSLTHSLTYLSLYLSGPYLWHDCSSTRRPKT
jgi:hypothetical protein